MKKIKIVAMLTATMFVCLAATSISGAVDLNADVNVTINGFIGIISPVVDISTEEQKNQTIGFLVNVTEPPGDEKNNSYKVDDKLVINLDITDETEREVFILPRFVFYRVIVARDLSDAIALPKRFGSLFTRLLPIKAPFGQVGVVSTLGGSQKATNFSINLKYRITNETFHNGENLTMYITVMGFLPGNINGIHNGEIPIIDRGIVNLKVTYIDNGEE